MVPTIYEAVTNLEGLRPSLNSSYGNNYKESEANSPSRVVLALGKPWVNISRERITPSKQLACT